MLLWFCSVRALKTCSASILLYILAFKILEYSLILALKISLIQTAKGGQQNTFVGKISVCNLQPFKYKYTNTKKTQHRH